MRTHAPEGADACLAPRVRASFSEERSGDGRGRASGQPSRDRDSFEALVARERAQRRQEQQEPLPLAPTGLPAGLPMGVSAALSPSSLPVPPPCGDIAPVTPPVLPGSGSHGSVLVTASLESGPGISGPDADGATARGNAPEEPSPTPFHGPALEASSPALGAVHGGGMEGGLTPVGQPVPLPAPPSSSLPRGVEAPTDPLLAAALAQGAPAGRVFRAVCHRLAALGDDWSDGEVAIHLAPPRLGRVRVGLSRGGGRTRATLVAYRAEGRAALIQGLDALREGLARHGVLLDLEVGLPAPPGEPRSDPPPGVSPGLDAWA